MPAGQGEEERFAAAVEQGTPPGAASDDELAHELALVAMLRAAGPALDPAPDAKARARQRLMAAFAEEFASAGPSADETMQLRHVPVGAAAETTTVIGRIEQVPDDDAEDDAERATVTELVPRSGRGPGRHAIPGSGGAPSTGRKRAAVIGAATLLTGMVLAGTAAASDNAMPGDTLYAFKGATESTGLALTFDEDEKARRYLELASLRRSEVERMVTDGQAAVADPALVQSVMDQFDASASEGSRMLLAADGTPDSTAVGEVRAWATEEQARLAALRDDLPGTVVVQAEDSLELLDDLLGRTEALQDLGEDALTGSGGGASGTGTADRTRTQTPSSSQRGATAGSQEPTGDAGPAADAGADVQSDDEAGGTSTGSRSATSGSGDDEGGAADADTSSSSDSGSGSGASSSGDTGGGLVGGVVEGVGGLLNGGR